jgi:peptidoglycan/LPS O-acetylase OafA/YrhL
VRNHPLLCRRNRRGVIRGKEKSLEERGDSGAINHTLPLLDWLRFGAAIMVVIKHSKDVSFPSFSVLPLASQTQILTKLLYALTRYGNEAVLIFFVLSGYLVGGSTFNRLRQGTFDVRSYATDRMTRILLPLFPAVLFTTALEVWQGVPVSPSVVLGNALSVQGVLTPILRFNHSLWTLTYEVWFYVLNGAIVAIIAGKSKLFAPSLVFLSLLIFSALKLDLLICWYLGVVAYFWSVKYYNTLSILFAVLMVVIAMLLNELAGQPAFLHYGIMAHLILGFGVVLLVRQLVAIKTNDTAIMRIGSKLSEFSYSLYLIHYPILFSISVFLPRIDAVNKVSLLQFLLRIFVSLLGGYIFYLSFERHTRAIQKYFRGGRATGEADGAPSA